MERKTKRVGLFSMGLVLIILGISILLSQFTRIDIIDLSLKLWPLVLILLGLEVLWMNYRNNSDESIRIKFDFTSIFIVMIILLVNLGLYGIYETGAIDYIRKYTNEEIFTFNDVREIELSKEVNKIVVEGVRGQDIDIANITGNKIDIEETRKISGQTEEEARTKLDKESLFIREQEDTIYLKVNKFNDFNDYLSRINIKLPMDRELEIVKGNDINISLDNMKQDLLIDNFRNINLKIKDNIYLEVVANVEYEDMLEGNVKWDIDRVSQDRDDNYIGKYKQFEARNKINILNVREKINLNRI